MFFYHNNKKFGKRAAQRLLLCKLNIKEKKKKRKKLLVLQPLQHIAGYTDNTFVSNRRYVFLPQQQQNWKKSYCIKKGKSKHNRKNKLYIMFDFAAVRRW